LRTGSLPVRGKPRETLESCPTHFYHYVRRAYGTALPSMIEMSHDLDSTAGQTAQSRECLSDGHYLVPSESSWRLDLEHGSRSNSKVISSHTLRFAVEFYLNLIWI